MACLRDTLEWCLRKSLAPDSIFLKYAISLLEPGKSSNDSSSEILSKPGFDDYYHRLANAVYEHGFPSTEATSALNKLRAFSPIPHVEVYPEGIWNRPTVLVWKHLKSTFDDAVANIESTGRTLSSDHRKYLQLLLTHRSGWSATYPERMNDHWATFFKISYPHIKGLALILDNITYPEEFKDLPDGRTPSRAGFFLLATPELYYVFDCQETLAGPGRGLNCAGQTLKEVYLGIKEYRYMDVEDPWEIEEAKFYASHFNYFPKYHRNTDGIDIKYEV